MLVLSRAKQQSVVFPDLGIEIKVIKCRSGQVKLGFLAPSDIRIARKEVADADSNGALGSDHADVFLPKAASDVGQAPPH